MKKFSPKQWKTINDYFDKNHAEFGFPEKRKDSIIISSFNIRKLGKVNKGSKKKSRSPESWRFFAKYLERCDLIAIQEVMDDLEGLTYLKDLLAPDYGMVASDITGGTPGKGGMYERLAFLFNWKRVERTEVASDISFDRSSVLNTLFKNRIEVNKDLKKYATALTQWEAKKKQGKNPKKPPMVMSHFFTFIRTPLTVSFRVPGLGNAKPYEFLAVNAHLLYGDKSKQKEEREMEFEALLSWLIARAKMADKLYHKNLILCGDLNLDFQEVDKRRDEIEKKITGYNKKLLRSKKAAKVNFPFLDVHPGHNTIIRSNARLNQTYDQIALFANDKRLPNDKANKSAGKTTGGFDYGCFNFADLFANALYGKPVNKLNKKEKKAFFASFIDDVSDHMPIWIRLPIPRPGL